MPEAPTTPPGKPRRRLSFSVRAMLIAVLIIALGLGWKINRAGTQKRAVALIEKVGGSVTYDHEFDGTYPYKSGGSPWGPAWLRARLGDEFFQEVTRVAFYDPVTDDQVAPVADFDRLLAIELHGKQLTDAVLPPLERLGSLREVRLEGTKVTDAGLARLGSLTGLRRLHLTQEGLSFEEVRTEEVQKALRELDHLPTFTMRVGEILRRRGTAITDVGLAHVAKLRHLQELQLSLPAITDQGLAPVGGLADLRVLKLINTNVNEAGLAHLEGLKNLRELTIAAEGVTDAGLAHLAGLTNLRALGFWFTRITDDGLMHLEGLHRLESLDLQRTVDLTDSGLAHLEGLNGLRELNLEGTMVTDAGLAHLAGLSGLEELNLSADEITDAGLAQLRGLKRLRRLKLDGTQVSGEGVASLVEAIPALVVSHSPGFFLMTTARKERAARKRHADLKQWMKEYNSLGGPTRPLPPLPPGP